MRFVIQAISYLLTHKSLLQKQQNEGCWKKETWFQDGAMIKKKNLRKILQLTKKGNYDICKYFPHSPSMQWSRALREGGRESAQQGTQSV